jgi:hypothetical protein
MLHSIEQQCVFTAAHMLCGVAKDLTKLGGKTVTKLVTPDEKEVRSCYKACYT